MEADFDLEADDFRIFRKRKKKRAETSKSLTDRDFSGC